MIINNFTIAPPDTLFIQVTIWQPTSLQKIFKVILPSISRFPSHTTNISKRFVFCTMFIYNLFSIIQRDGVTALLVECQTRNREILGSIPGITAQ